MGRVVSVLGDRVVVEGCGLKPGDGIVFDAADWRSPQESEEGGRIYEIERTGRDLRLSFANGAVNFSRIRSGYVVWRTHDPALEKKIVRVPRRQAVRIRARARVGEQLLLEWNLESKISVSVQSDVPLGAAESRPLTREFLLEQLGRLGDSPYELAVLELDAEGLPFALASLLNQLRRQAVAMLQEHQTAVKPFAWAQRFEAAAAFRSGDCAGQKPGGSLERLTPQVHLLVRTPDQLEAALTLCPASITLDYLDLYGLRPSLDRVKASGIEARVASPRVLKPGEERIVDFLLRCNCPILVRSTGLLDSIAGRTPHALTGDFSLNAANGISSRELLCRGLSRLMPTHDLNAAQIAELAESAGAGWIEVAAYHHLPVFHTEHCVFCRFLSSGTSYRDCGRPCEHHRIELRDQDGRPQPVLADVGCRNTVFGAEAQQASRHLEPWLEAGIRHFRLEFVTEAADAVVEISRVYEAALNGRISASEIQNRLRQFAPQGITERSFYVPQAAAAFPILR
jgi:putative protease